MQATGDDITAQSIVHPYNKLPSARVTPHYQRLRALAALYYHHPLPLVLALNGSPAFDHALFYDSKLHRVRTRRACSNNMPFPTVMIRAPLFPRYRDNNISLPRPTLCCLCGAAQYIYVAGTRTCKKESICTPRDGCGLTPPAPSYTLRVLIIDRRPTVCMGESRNASA